MQHLISENSNLRSQAESPPQEPQSLSEGWAFM